MSKKLATQEEHHEDLVKGFSDQVKQIMESSTQPVFIYLDDNHKACNGRFATLLGYDSPQEWAEKQGFLDPFVTGKSQETLSTAYWNGMKKLAASTIQLTLKKKDGGTVESTMILVPMPYEGHIFTIHFVTSPVVG